MSYNVSQLRRSEIQSYSTPIPYTIGQTLNEDAVIDFYDRSISFSAENVLSGLYSYYLKFDVQQDPDNVQNFEIVLLNTKLVEDNSMTIGSYVAKQGTGVSSFELIFTPNANYNCIVFKLKRTLIDFQIDPPRIMNIVFHNMESVTNVISTYLHDKYTPDLTVLKKIGVVGPPGLLMVINGEEIHIGRSGIYELENEDIKITYMGFIIKDSTITQDGKDYFIMDFKY